MPIMTGLHSATTYASSRIQNYVTPQGIWIFPYAVHGIILMATGLAHVSASAIVFRGPSKGDRGNFDSLWLGLDVVLVLLWFFSSPN